MIEVTKRDGRIEKFDIWKIRQVVMLAISQAGMEFEIEDVYDISTLVEERVKHRDKISVEEISDIVERVLAENGYFEASKAYILYRDMRNRERLQEEKPGLLSNEFLSKYKKRKEPFNQLGAFVFYRTYSRFLPEKGRREYWWETVRRVVEFNCGLAPTSVKEAEMIYDNIFNLRQVPSGRALFTGGTEASQKYRLSCFNCSFLVLDSFEKYSELFYLLLVGAGVGIRVLKEDVAQLPKIRTDIEVVHEAYKAKPATERAEYTSVTFKGNQAHIYIGDSKEAWKQALDHFFDIFSKQEYYKVKQIIFNYDNVRPKGERLKTFGGRSSGYESMQEMFEGIVKVISKYEASKVQLKPIDCMDIANLIGVNVVSGGTRRSSEIILFSPDDEEIKNAKSNLYVNDNGHWSLNQEIAHRTLSNNSVYYESKPSFEEWEKHIKTMRFSSEPGFVNAEYGKKIREDFMGCNPCFTGDMKLLTEDGYKTFKELDGTEPIVISPNRKKTKGKVWCSGEKEIVELTLDNGVKIRCTPNHVFMTEDQYEIQAKDTTGVFLEGYFRCCEVVSVKPAGKELVYDFTEPETHWGYVNGVLAHNCAEITLTDRQVCNLTEVNLMAFVKEDGSIDYENLITAQRLSARMGYRMACVDMELHEWNKANKRDMLIGCSLTGIQDFRNVTQISQVAFESLLQQLRDVAHESANQLADELGKNRPLLATTVKPSGCWTKEFVRVFDDGIFTIDELTPTELMSDGFNKVSHKTTVNGFNVTKTFKNTKQDILKFTLKNGRTMKISKEHPMSIDGQWVKAKDIKVGDKIDYQFGTYKNQNHAKLKTLDSIYKINEVKATKLPDVMSEDLAYLLGAYYANGCFTTHNRIRFTSNNYDVHLKVQSLWKKLFGIETSIKELTDRKAFAQDFRSAIITEWLVLNGLDKYVDMEKGVIPIAVRSSHYLDILSFFVGYVDNDGCFNASTISIDSANEEFMRHMQQVGEAVGLCFGLSINKARKNSFSKKPIYKLNLWRTELSSELADYLNKHSIKVGQSKDKILPSQRKNVANPYTVREIEVLKDQQTYDIEVDQQHWYYQGALKSHNTVSLVMNGVSPGVHYSHSPYYIRRVRISANDPLLKVVRELEYPVFPEVGQEEETANTFVVEFPCKAPQGKTKENATADEQVDNYLTMMDNYVDHNVSITVSVRDNEWEDLTKRLYDEWDNVLAMSFMSLDDSFYQLMPYESITEEEYNKRKADMKPFNPNLISKYEEKYEEYDLGSDCDSGVCPVR